MGASGRDTARGQLCSPALLNLVVVFLTCPQSLNYCCSKHTTTLLPRKLDRKHLLGSGSSPPYWFEITPTVRFLDFFSPRITSKPLSSKASASSSASLVLGAGRATARLSPWEAGIAHPVHSQLKLGSLVCISVEMIV